jgi:hypothetical protein
MVDFLNRTDDLVALDDLWTSREAQFFVVWGPARAASEVGTISAYSRSD